jgi:hypothetical protein
VVGEAEIMMTTEALPNMVAVVGVVVMVAVLMEKAETPFMVQGAVEEEVAVPPLAQMAGAGGHTLLVALPLVVGLLAAPIMARMELVETSDVVTAAVGLEPTQVVTQGLAAMEVCLEAAAAAAVQVTIMIMAMGEMEQLGR